MNAIETLEVLKENWTLALGLALSVFGVTWLATLLHKDSMEGLAFSLKGAKTDEAW